MKITSIIAIYMLFWVMSAFIVLRVGVKTAHDTGEEILPGHADSAPTNFNPRRIVKLATILATVLFGLYYANYVNGWIGVEDINILTLLGISPQ